MTWRMAALVGITVTVLIGVTVVSGFPPPLRPFAAELWRGQAEAQRAKAGSQTVSHGPSTPLLSASCAGVKGCAPKGIMSPTTAC